MPAEGALVIYGRGGGLGDLSYFAEDLIPTELADYDERNVRIEHVERRDAFFSLLNTAAFGFTLKALHIISHAYGPALALGYGDPRLQEDRARMAARGPASYLTALNTEAGMIFTDDLIRTPYSGYRDRIRSLFADHAQIKIWGCNSGISGWQFSDVDTDRNPVYDRHAVTDAAYYWRALHERHPHKPSIAQAIADYFQVKTYGAGSGTSIQVRHSGKWVSHGDFMKRTGRRPPVVRRDDELRLWPDRGDYRAYQPR